MNLCELEVIENIKKDREILDSLKVSIGLCHCIAITSMELKLQSFNSEYCEAEFKRFLTELSDKVDKLMEDIQVELPKDLKVDEEYFG